MVVVPSSDTLSVVACVPLIVRSVSTVTPFASSSVMVNVSVPGLRIT